MMMWLLVDGWGWPGCNDCDICEICGRRIQYGGSCCRKLTHLCWLNLSALTKQWRHMMWMRLETRRCNNGDICDNDKEGSNMVLEKECPTEENWWWWLHSKATHWSKQSYWQTDTKHMRILMMICSWVSECKTSLSCASNLIVKLTRGQEGGSSSEHTKVFIVFPLSLFEFLITFDS